MYPPNTGTGDKGKGKSYKINKMGKKGKGSGKRGKGGKGGKGGKQTGTIQGVTAAWVKPVKVECANGRGRGKRFARNRT